MKNGVVGLSARIFFIILCSVSLSLSQDKGINYYQNREFEEARNYYESLIRERGNNPQAQFGRGSSSFQQGDMETAEKAFEQSLKSSDLDLRSKALYNLGNTFYKNKKTEEALAYYRKALELDPNDTEAKYNYEFLRYQQDPPENDNQKQDQSKEEENKEEQDQEKQEEKDQQDKEEEKDQQDKEEEKDQENQEQQQQEQQQKQQEASEEQKTQDLKQAESILDALKQDEKIMQKQQISRAKSRKLAKDW
tara:strand:- start:1475 stop:2224 length:750 start_codon:yes stop_codon:yes gene_type:complete